AVGVERHLQPGSADLQLDVARHCDLVNVHPFEQSMVGASQIANDDALRSGVEVDVVAADSGIGEPEQGALGGAYDQSAVDRSRLLAGVRAGDDPNGKTRE